MADRSVVVRLTARIDGFKQGMTDAATATRKVGDEADKSKAKQASFGKDLVASAGKNKEAWTQVGTGFVVAGAAITGTLAAAVKKSMDFDAAMSGVGAATMQTGKTLDALRQTAIDAGASTQYSATEAADGITAMAKAGVSAKDIMGGGLTGALNLAAAGQLGVADASEIAATALTQYGLSGKDLPHVADLLAAGAGKAQGSVQDLGNALKYVGPLAKGMNISIDETVGVLGEFASQGIIGEQAGTSLRGMLSSLSAPSMAAANELKLLNINLYDGTGKFIGMSGAAQALQDGLGGLTDQQRDQALGQIFGNEQLTAARILYQGGAKSVKEWTDKVNDTGYATRQAAELTNNLKGDLERLGGAFDTALISSGSKANGVLRKMVKELTGVVDVYNSMPSGVQTAVTVFGALTGAVSLLGGGLLIAAPRIVATRNALDEMGRTGAFLKGSLKNIGSVLAGPWGLALGAATVGLAVWADQHAKAKARVDELTQAIEADSQALGENTRDALANTLQKSSAVADAKALGINLGDVTAALTGNADAQERVNIAILNAQSAYAPYIFQSGKASTQVYEQGQAATDLANIMQSTTGEVGKAAQAAQDHAALVGDDATAMTDAGDAGVAGASGVNSFNSSVIDATAAEQTAVDTTQALKDALDALYGKYYSVREATDNYHSATNALSDSVKQNGHSLKGNSDAAIANRDALRHVATSANDVISTMVDQGKSYEDVKAKSKKLKAEFVEQARKAHLSGAQVDALKGYLDKLPGTYAADIKANGISDAEAKLRGLQKTIDGLRPRTVPISVVIGVDNKLNANPRLLSKSAATGGYISGPGTSTSDSIPARLSDGEFVIKASATKRHRGLLEDINADRYAAGGFVTPPGDRYAAAYQASARTQRFADGGLASRPASTAPALATRQVIFTGDLVSPSVDQLARQVVTRIRRDEALHPTYY